MATMTLTGKSQQVYTFNLFPIGTNLKSGAGCYAFVKDLTNNQYPLVYIGETGDLSERFDSHHKMPCIRQNGATQIGVHRTNSKQAAQNIEEDVLGRYSPPCNG